MKKTLIFLLALIMLLNVMFISIFSAEPMLNSSQEGAACECGGAYGAWTYPTGKECQGSRYYRQCDSCESTQTAKDIFPTTISYSVPAIGANVGDTVTLSLYSVYYTSSAVMNADSIVWSSEDIEIVNGCIYPTATGVYQLTATSGSNVKTVYLIVKNPSDSEYVLFLDDFNGTSLSEDYRELEIPTGTEYYVSDGKLVLDATGNDANQMRILLPSWVGEFGNYKIDTKFTILSTHNSNTTYWFAVMARIQKGDYPFWQAAIRQNAAASSGVEIAKRTKASGQSNGWTVVKKCAYTSAISASEYYTQTFELNGKVATHSINGKSLLTYESLDYSAGDVGFHVRASVVSIDSIKISVPIDDSIHDFGNWTTVTADTCTSDGKEVRYCSNCDVVEERVIAGGHKIVNHELKAPTCTESGWRAYETCERCDYTTFKGEVPALGHYFDREIKCIAHRGYSNTAPENTLPAYILARELGFLYAECDVAFTKDGVAVLLHDATIDRTSNGSGALADLTFEEIREYDFGSWKNAKYAGTKIPSFEEFIALCKEIGLHPYIEIKNDTTYTQEQIQSLVNIVKKYGMEDNCSWISFSLDYLGYVKNADDTARLGYVSSKDITQTVINSVLALRTGKNEVFLDNSYNMLNENNVMLAALSGLTLETWTVDSTNEIKNRPKYVSGYSSNKLVATDTLLKTAVTAPGCDAQGYTTYTCLCGATKVADYTDATGHTAENGICTECNAEIYCNDSTHNLEIVSISYENGFDNVGIKIVKCLDCHAMETEATAPALFVCRGYSVPEGDRIGVAVTFNVNLNAISEYENASECLVSFGGFAAAQSVIGDKEIFGNDGKAQSGVICADVTELAFSEFSVVVVGFTSAQQDLPFAMGAYVAVANEYSYIQAKNPEENKVYSFDSYNGIMNAINGKGEVQ